MMLTGKASTVVRRLREEDADTLGRVMVLPKDHSWVRQAVLSKGLLDRTIDREVDSVAIVVAVVVDVVGPASRPRHRSWMTIRLRIWLLIPFGRLSCLARLWKL